MATRTAQLIAQLVDRVSGPAKGMASALDGVAASSKRLGQGIASPALDKLTKDLKDAQAQAEKLAQLQARMKTLGESRGAFNTSARLTETLELNPGLAALGAVLPLGTPVTLPDLPPAAAQPRAAVPAVSLFDDD